MSGIYFHIPFCKQKCTYCDFHFSTTFHAYRDQLLQKMHEELEMRRNYLPDKTIQSIYFGGGTPSLLTAEELTEFINQAKHYFDVSPNAEITLEANPDDISELVVRNWKLAGINRLSIGLQSFRAEDLKWMNRTHTVQEATESVKIAQQAGIDNITVDLIYGLPGLSLSAWESHIDRVLDMQVPHISAYCLTVEEKTALHHLVEKQKIVPGGEDDQSEQFLLLVQKLKNAGFHHYEISNFGKPGFEAVHNSNYWKGTAYLGIGPSAHSFNGTSRRWNIASNPHYLKSSANTTDWYEEEILSAKDHWNELVLTGLRTSFGVQKKSLEALFPYPQEFTDTISHWKERNLLIETEVAFYLTEAGRLQADLIASELFVV